MKELTKEELELVDFVLHGLTSSMQEQKDKLYAEDWGPEEKILWKELWKLKNEIKKMIQ